MHRTRSRIVRTLALTLGLWMLVVPAANAYVDPGTGAFIFQALIAGLLAAGLTVKMWWRKVKSLFTGREPEPVETADRS